MTGSAEQHAAARGYVVLQEVEPGLWHLVGEADHQPGLPARAGRVQAVRDATGGAVREDEIYAALQRDQWHVVRGG